MTELSLISTSNSKIASAFPSGLTAVFVGGTSGVGEYTLKALSKYVPRSKFYIIGRSKESADRIIRECTEQNHECCFEFINADISQLQRVDNVSRQIVAKENSINLLFQTQGTMAFKKTTADGLPLTAALGIHTRIRFIQNFLPLIQRAEGLKRVVTVGAGTCEGGIDLDNILAVGAPLLVFRDQLASVMTLALERLSEEAPDVSFVHTCPGVVDSGISRDAEGFSLKVMLFVSSLLKPLVSTPPAECGERHVFAATSGVYSPRKRVPNSTAFELAGLPLSRGSTGEIGSGVYSVGPKSEILPDKAILVLKEFREDGTTEKVWSYIMESFESILGTSKPVQ
ncbi:hypothetical protein TRIATDRAFT_90330 [Trichoderma atroviride IMI 206040]|uniref:Short-chain dehydrogenases/reductase n=1 Tax=Hypocrea atroviridis (strain ATCC 20476 / IMI 206040) TaxID=452589 RepID=G9NP67_HYPAI|nr:uncharacterized protein TRIATDRAFT_90330 [Trichoderma atroviride IMI 206040]EHK47852.1 hypothetical protein TRIATDRAFT_90330 [Trichoderma atroviride IMI 206040]